MARTCPPVVVAAIPALMGGGLRPGLRPRKRKGWGPIRLYTLEVSIQACAQPDGGVSG